MAKIFMRLMTLFLLPCFVLYSFDTPALTIHSPDAALMYLPDDYTISYDDILDLLEEIEEGDLENRCTIEQLSRINHFLAHLARSGLLPDASREELENDIDDLLINPHEPSFSFASPGEHDYKMALYGFSSYELSLCKKGWIHRTWDHTKKFVKKHKKALLIGVAVIAVATIAIYALPAIAAGGAAAAVAGDAASADSEDNSDPDEDADVAQAPSVQEVIEEHISSFKEIVVEEGLLPDSQHVIVKSDHSIGEIAREVASTLAHEAFDGIASIVGIVPEGLELVKENLPARGALYPENSPVAWKDVVAYSHKKIDQIFCTERAPLYLPEVKAMAAQFREHFGTSEVTAILPPPGFLKESMAGSAGRITVASDAWGWKIGEKITNRTLFGTVPKWSTVRRRYWKNQAHHHPERFTPENLERARQGLAEQRRNLETGQLETMELHHMPSQRDGGLFDFVELWPEEHAAADSHRHLGGCK